MRCNWQLHHWFRSFRKIFSNELKNNCWHMLRHELKNLTCTTQLHISESNLYTVKRNIINNISASGIIDKRPVFIFEEALKICLAYILMASVKIQQLLPALRNIFHSFLFVPFTNKLQKYSHTYSYNFTSVLPFIRRSQNNKRTRKSNWLIE